MPIDVNYTPYHYECSSKKLAVHEAQESLKERVYTYMDKLEGWCSKEKASILIDAIVEMRPKVIVEIGVFGGKSLIPMAFALQYNKKGKIYGVDPWSESASAAGMEGQNLEWWSSVDHSKILHGLQNRIKEFHLENRIELIQETSINCPPIANINILHIDGNHSEETSLQDVLKWVPLVERGGLIIFDDVNWSTTKLATEWLDTNCIKMAEYRGDNVWGIWIKT
ncbi:MAG TPA: class I SAM-dependent methyltransferase [Parachlamydiaceae bacterium]|nr:class I SAM-dependent methyltransferase [Parachlamydiaceae bacterium]